METETTSQSSESMNSGKELQQRGQDALAEAQDFEIQSDADYQIADQRCVVLLEFKKTVKEHYQPSKESAHRTWKNVCEAEAKSLGTVDEARDVYKQKLGSWDRKKEIERQAEERRQQEEARKKAEDQAIAQAEAAEKAGNKAAAEAIIAAPILTPAVVIPKATPQRQTKLRMVWVVEIIDEQKAIAAAINDPSLRSLLAIDESAAKKFAELTNGREVPGIKFTTKKV